MRHLTIASALVLVGIAAAVPFRQSSSEKSSPSEQIASGPLGEQLSPDAALNVSQWIDRSETDPAIAWQSQPMSFERDAHALELPEMPAEFSFDEVDKAIPQPIKSRFGAAVASAPPTSDGSRTPVAAVEPMNLQAPPLAGDEFEPLPSAAQARGHELAVQGVSTAASSSQTSVMRPPLPTHATGQSVHAASESQTTAPIRYYIREPN